MAVTRWRLRRRLDETLTDQPGYALVGVVRIPQEPIGPFRLVIRRIGLAIAAILAAAVIVYLDRSGYHDSAGGQLSALDCLYYSAVTMSTIGYGDITPVSEVARLTNVLVIAPLRLALLIMLVGTTIEVAAETSRQAWRIRRWRDRVRNHNIVIGYGTKGKTAVAAMLDDGVPAGEIVVVDTEKSVLNRADSVGLVTVHGDATKSDVLRLAGAQRAASIVVATNRDDTAVLVTLTARELAPTARIVAAIREAENQHLMRQSGADSVVVSSETVGRLLGIATTAPGVVGIIEDLLTPDERLSIAERDITPAEIGTSMQQNADVVLGVMRAGTLIRAGTAKAESIQAGDRLLYLRHGGQ